MNELIHKLAEHCDFYVGNEHYNKSYEEQQRLFMEKFAELVVRECASVDLYWLSKQDRKSIAEKIKQHFGVES